MGLLFTSAALATVSVAGVLSLTIYRRTAPAEQRRIQSVGKNPASFNSSVTVKQFVNPKSHPSLDDTRSIIVNIPQQRRGLSDEALLATFIQGFFGGWVFAIERIMLRTFRMNLVHYSFPKVDDAETPIQIWSKSQLHGDSLPPLYSKFFGTFQVADTHICTADSPVNGNTESSIDIVFGSQHGRFAGVHQFSVMREGHADEKTPICLQYSHTSCNPTVNKPVRPELLFTFHKLYAMLLFREGVSEVIRRLERPE